MMPTSPLTVSIATAQGPMPDGVDSAKRNGSSDACMPARPPTTSYPSGVNMNAIGKSSVVFVTLSGLFWGGWVLGSQTPEGQEALARACESIGDLRDSAAAPAWYLRIVTTVCLRNLRRRKLRRTVFGRFGWFGGERTGEGDDDHVAEAAPDDVAGMVHSTAGAPVPGKALEDRQQLAALIESLDGLSAQQRDAIKRLLTERLRRDGLPSTVVTDRTGDILQVMLGVPTLSDLRKIAPTKDTSRVGGG